jgi:dipeptidyl aminopeptidase/acylaminoacyl peptidase
MGIRKPLGISLLCVAAALAAGADFTLEQVMAGSFCSGLSAAPAGARIAWIANRGGVRNLFAADGPDYEPRQVTRYTEDDGTALASPVWLPDASALVFVRGSEPREGDYPNPASLAEGAEQAVWVAPAAGSQPRRLDEGAEPAVSPSGDRVAYIKRGQIWAARTAGEPRPVLLVRTRGTCGSLRWSPDGSALAFVVARGDHSFVGILDAPEGRVRFLDAGVDRDSEPVWSPDGKRIAFLRIPTARELIVFGPKRAAEPWSLRVADAASGRGREVWRARPGRGSVFRAITAPNQILWAAEDRLVFPWEADGWTHLYSVRAAGGEAALLTPGEFEVEYAAAAPDGRAIVYASNQGDPDRRHLWRVAPAGGAPERLTSGDGIEWAPVVTGDGRAVAYLGSNAREPGRPFVLEAGVKKDVWVGALAAEYPKDALVEPQPVTLPASDGLEIRGQVFARPAPSGERRPAVVFFHGGPRRQMLLGWHPMEYYHNAYAFNQYLASRGYLVLSVNFRSGTGYGMEFREAAGYGAAGASEFADVAGAVRYLRARPDVDPARIGAWGGSYGGYLVALGLARAPELLAAGVDLHGVHDWRTETRLYLDSDDFEVQQAARKLALESSPLGHVKTWRSPVLLIHGDDDPSVAFGQTVQLVEALRRQGVVFEQLVFPDEVHEFLRHARWLEAFSAAADFLDRHLKKRPMR